MSQCLAERDSACLLTEAYNLLDKENPKSDLSQDDLAELALAMARHGLKAEAEELTQHLYSGKQAEAPQTLGYSSGANYWKLAETAYWLGDAAQTAKLLAEADAALADWTKDDSQKLRYYAGLAAARLRTGDESGANAVVKTHLTTLDSLVSGLIALSRAHSDRGDAEAAVAALERAMFYWRRRGGDSPIWRGRGERDESNAADLARLAADLNQTTILNDVLDSTSDPREVGTSQILARDYVKVMSIAGAYFQRSGDSDRSQSLLAMAEQVGEKYCAYGAGMIEAGRIAEVGEVFDKQNVCTNPGQDPSLVEALARAKEDTKAQGVLANQSVHLSDRISGMIAMARIWETKPLDIVEKKRGPIYSDGYQEGLKAYEQEDYAKALQIWRDLAEQGDASGNIGVGLIFLSGLSVPKDNAKALEWFRRGAEQGHSEGQYRLARALERGDGVTENLVEARQWYEKAAQDEHNGAIFNLGIFYEYGDGGEQSYGKAANLYERAGSRGHSAAQYAMGMLFLRGSIMGNKSDSWRQGLACYWLRKSAKRNFAQAQYVLGDLMSSGGLCGGPDIDKAVVFLRRAAERGNGKAKERLRELGQ